MLDAVCEPCGGRVLIGTRQIIRVHHTEAGIELAYVCHCGRVGAQRTGRAAQRSRAAAMSVRPPSATSEGRVM